MRVLIVDDDEMVRFVCSGMLRVLQHEVTSAASGEEALELLSQQGKDFGLLLIDDSMPTMSGREVLRELYRRGCRIPTVICSGHEVDLADFVIAEDYSPLAMLRKPFTIQQLQKAVDTAHAGE